MAIYRVDCGRDDDGHTGYEYCATLREAKRVVAVVKRMVRDNPSLFDVEPSIESRPTPRNKREWVTLLNEWGSHNDNG